MNNDGIVLLNKNSGVTSFSSLNSIKKALKTKKVGHTGTLDSFAKGLLVVCTGRLTKLAGNITDFSKTYRAVIEFGKETDTLEYTGKIIKETDLPDENTLNEVLKRFIGKLKQTPPAFSSIHINGKRSSDLARSGQINQIPPREITVYSSKIIEIKKRKDEKVQYVLIEFNVSKGTYIRSLARDIGIACNSSGYLIGLYRTSIGNFGIEDAAGFNSKNIFNIESAVSEMKYQLKILQKKNDNKTEKKIPYVPDEQELFLQEEIRSKLKECDEELSILCGFTNIYLKNNEALEEFKNGKPLKSKNFNIDLHSIKNNSTIAVFSSNKKFTGLIEKDEQGRVHYKFVIN